MKKLLSLGVLTLSSFMLVACSGNNKAADEKKSNSVSTTQEKAAETYFKDDTLKIDMATLKILSTEVLPANEGLYREKPQLVFTYEVANDSDELIAASTVWIACMVLTQDTEGTVTKLNVGMTPQDEKFSKFTEHQLDDIKPGSTTKAIIAYDLDDTETPVILKISQGMAGKELGEKMVNLK